MPSDDDALFGELVVLMGHATQQQIDECVEAQKVMSGVGVEQSLGEVMVSKGVIGRDVMRDVTREAMKRSGKKARIGPYEVLSKVGQGGMGAVYRARLAETGTMVAVKVLPPALARNQGFVERFRREAAVAAELDHPNVVRAISAGESGGYHYFAMEFVEGENLGDRLKRDIIIPHGEALKIVREVSLALQHAHEAGLVHRDIKPDNIFLTPDGQVKLGDLGLARQTGEGASDLTQPGVMVGTPYYVSPEQARGERDVDIRGDIYSLGATLYHMVTGRVPFQGDTSMAVLQKHLTEDLAWPADVNEELGEEICLLIQKMLAKNPTDRYQEPLELIGDIDMVSHGMMPLLASQGFGESSVKSRKVKKVALAVEGRRLRGDTAVASAGPAGITTSTRMMTPAKKSRVPLIAVGVAGAVMVAVAAFVFLGGPEEAERVTKPGPGTPEPAKAEPEAVTAEEGPEKEDFGRAYERIMGLWKANPDQYGRAMAAFSKLQRDARGTVWAKKAADAVAEVRKAQREALFAKRPRPASIPAAPRTPPRPAPAPVVVTEEPPPAAEAETEVTQAPEVETWPPALPAVTPAAPRMIRRRVKRVVKSGTIDYGAAQILHRETFDGPMAAGWEWRPTRGTTFGGSPGAAEAPYRDGDQYDAVKFRFAFYHMPFNKRPLRNGIFLAGEDTYVSFYYHVTGSDTIAVYGRNERIKRNPRNDVKNAKQGMWAPAILSSMDFCYEWDPTSKSQKGDLFSELLIAAGGPGDRNAKLLIDNFVISKGPRPTLALRDAVVEVEVLEEAPAAPPRPAVGPAVLVEQRRKAYLRKNLFGLMDEIEALALDCEFDKAKSRIAEARGEEKFGEASEAVGAAAKVVEELGLADEVGRKGLKDAVGKSVVIKLGNKPRSCKITAVHEDSLEVERVDRIGGRRVKASLRVKLSSLDAAALHKVKGEYKPETPDGHIAAAILALARKDEKEAWKSLREAGEHPLATWCRHRIDPSSVPSLEPEAAPAPAPATVDIPDLRRPVPEPAVPTGPGFLPAAPPSTPSAPVAPMPATGVLYSEDWENGDVNRWSGGEVVHVTGRGRVLKVKPRDDMGTMVHILSDWKPHIRIARGAKLSFWYRLDSRAPDLFLHMKNCTRGHDSFRLDLTGRHALTVGAWAQFSVPLDEFAERSAGGYADGDMCKQLSVRTKSVRNISLMIDKVTISR